jgi:hypothetical protein
MIIKLFLIAIILYIVINQLMEKNQPIINKPVINKPQKEPVQVKVPVQINQQTRLQYNVIEDEYSGSFEGNNKQQISNQQHVERMSMQPHVERMSIQPNVERMSNQPHVERMSIQPNVERMSNQPHVERMSIQPNVERMSNQPHVERMSNNTVQEFERPLPWTKIIYIEENEFPYNYHFKPVIPSLNDFENWKQIIPNINFNPNSRELIIPSKDEASALAVANLICINFSGQMTMQDILNKDLIRISITKAKTHELVRTKLKEQIMEVLYGKSFNKVQTNYEEDLAKHNINDTVNNNNQHNNQHNNIVSNKPISLKSDDFKDTFHHFSDNMINSNEIGAYDGSDYSYL